MSFVYIVKLIPLGGVTDESSQTLLAEQRNTEVYTIIDAQLNDRCYKRASSIHTLPLSGHLPIRTPSHSRRPNCYSRPITSIF